MSDRDRLDAIEEALMRLESEIEQLDQALRAQARDRDALTQRVERLECRLARLEPDEDPPGSVEEPRMNTNGHGSE